MAPVKRSTTTAPRETRTTRANAIAKKKVATAEKKTDSVTVSKPPPNSTRSTVSTRKGKKRTPEQEEVQPEELISVDILQQDDKSHEIVQPARTRATRATAASAGLAAAPRRRIKITPLDVSAEDKIASKATPKDDEPKPKDTSAKKTSSRTKKVDDELEEIIPQESAELESKVKSSRKGASKAQPNQDKEKPSAPKTRGRPKLQKSEEQKEPPPVEPEQPAATRSTRSTRAGSVASLVALETQNVVPSTKTANGTKKKVTFQDLPSENDKENQPLPSTRSKKTNTKKDSESTKAATGLRAKPLRKPVTTATRARKATSAVAAGTDEASSQQDNAKPRKKMIRVLTPKKITQVARSGSPEMNDVDMSDDEDELNGGKTPIRDLSVSPRRPITAALARALSPAKKLDFGQSLIPKPPERTAILRGADMDQTGMLASPARRPAASPFKDGLKDSPKRGLQEGAMWSFPTQSDTSSSIALNATNSTAAGQTMQNMLQSPKRTGLLDPNFFSHSAMKKSATKSPLKSSLFGTPARRLFSPAKKSSTPSLHKVIETETNHDTEDMMEIESEVTASSHFRSSVSPFRVMRVETNAMSMDFDDSILEVRSPLKVQKSPVKIPPQPDFDIARKAKDGATDPQRHTSKTDSQVVEPSNLEIAPAPPSEDETITTETEQPEVVHELGQKAKDETAVQADETVVSGQLTAQSPVRRQSLSQILFRSKGGVSGEESSEDELAGEKTPIKQRVRVRSSIGNHQVRSRISDGLPPSALGKGFGFTPLAAQMSGWLASSPEKSPEQPASSVAGAQRSDFSPLAREHIEGEVVISRDSTPLQKLSKRLSAQLTSSSRLAASNRKSTNLRKSFTQRQSVGAVSNTDSPVRDQQFEEYMEIRAIEEQTDADNLLEKYEVNNDERDFDQIMDIAGQSTESQGNDDTILDEDQESERQLTEQTGDLTTDLIKFTHASDTAMVDFQKLAEEANQMASDEPDPNESETESVDASELGQGDTVPIAEFYDNIDRENVDLEARSLPHLQEESLVEDEKMGFAAISPLLQPIDGQLESPSMLVINQRDSPLLNSSSPVSSSVASPAQQTTMRTPPLNLRINERRIVNTVVSKVPLKPEGIISPIKMPKKRSRSFGNADASPAKRISFENLRELPSKVSVAAVESPDRRVRTSVAPSPGGTSTPATSRLGARSMDRLSFGGASAVTTPGQMSFAVDDFGDSTLDGIELPEDFEMTEMPYDEKSPARSVVCNSVTTTPKAKVAATPVTSKRSARRATTPATLTNSTPKTAQKASLRTPAGMDPERTPLGPVGKGILHGATIFVDVHTSEGADASGIFTELLVQMGAKCVKDWRWNSRMSLAPEAETELPEQKIGITHVVYKDGGKRTLEKVRDAKGEVCCVGVAWVLDCERENKWLDESSYTVDTNILPRGGSKRRKSMEPRALLVAGDGSVSASRASRSRSVSAEMNELMKRELLNTPARGQSPIVNRYDEQDSDNDENIEQTTPTGFVSYDPRIAMTPGTPYLISQGKKLTQMSAPPKQQNKSLFEDEEGENDDTFIEASNENSGAVKDAKKFRMKNLGDMAKRRRTLGWKPAIGSPLSRM